MAKETKSLKKSETDVSLNQPEEFTSFTSMDLPVVEEPAPPPPPPKPAPPKHPSTPKKYRCTIRCWVSSKVLLCNPGDIVEFADGEFVPSQFELAE